MTGKGATAGDMHTVRDPLPCRPETPVPATVTAAVESLVSRGLIRHGAGIFASVEGSCIVDVCWGEARSSMPFTRDTLFGVRCALKPVLALAVMSLVGDGALTLDTRVADHLDGFDGLKAEITVAHLLTHTSGLSEHFLELSEADFPHLPTRSERMLAVARDAQLPAGWRPGRQAAYSPGIDWQVLAAVIESVTGSTASELVSDRILEPLALADIHFGPTPAQWKSLQPRYGLHHATLEGEARVEEVDDSHICDFLPGDGGITSVTELGALYEAMLGHRHDVRSQARASWARDLAISLVQQQRPLLHDLVEDQTRPFGLGLAVDMRLYHVSPRLSPHSFGHGAISGSVTGLADPDSGLALAVLFNDHLPAPAAVYRRMHLVDAVLDAVGAS